MQVQVGPDGTVLGYGTFTAEHEDPNIRIVEIDQREAEKFEQSGVKTLGNDGTITVTPSGD